MQLMMKAWLLPRKVNLSTQFSNSLKFLYDCRSFTIKTKSFVYFPHLYTRLYENGYKRVQVYRFLPSHAEPLQLPTRRAPSGQNVVLICKTVTMWKIGKEKRYVSENCPTHTLPSVTFCILQLFLSEAPTWTHRHSCPSFVLNWYVSLCLVPYPYVY